MDALDRIRTIIEGFGGYAEPNHRRVSDEQIRAFVGEALAGLPAVEIDKLPEDERRYYDRVLLRCEFINQELFRLFDGEPTVERMEALLLADLEVIEAALAVREMTGATLNGVLLALNAAFDKREAAMQLR
jgi:hypothetical protein